MRKVYSYKVIGFYIIAIILSIIAGQTSWGKTIFLFTPPVFSPLSIILMVFLIDYLIFILLKVEERSKPDKKQNKGFLYIFAYYLGIAILGIATIYIIRQLYFLSDLNFKVSALFDIGLKEIVWFFVMINIFIAYTLLSLYLYTKSARYSEGYKQKALPVALVLIIFIFLSYFIFDISSFIPLALSFLIFITVLDLYTEKLILNSTWIFTWMILIAGFSSLIIFSAYTVEISGKRIKKLKQVIYLPKKDIKDFFKASKNNNAAPASHIFSIDTLDEKSFLNILNTGYYSIGDNIYFNPLKGDYLHLDKELPEKKYIVSQLQNDERKKRFFREQFKFLLLNNEKVLYNNTGLTQIPVPVQQSDTTAYGYYNKDGYSYLSYTFDDNLKIINIEKIPRFYRPLSLFSLLFVIVGIYIFIISVINSKFEFLPKYIYVSFKGVHSLRDRIQFSIIGLLIISFVVLGLTIFYYFYHFHQRNQLDRARLFAETVDLLAANTSDKQDLIYDQLTYLSKEYGIQILYYDTTGILHKDIGDFNDKNPVFQIDTLLNNSKAINSAGRYLYKKDKSILAIIPIKNGTKKTGYVVGIFEDNNSIVFAASDILSNFLNVYVLLFLIAGAIAIALANSISKPLEILGDKLEVLNLSNDNQLLKWDRTDEIGKLISIYNETAKKLEESAKIITKIERDSAWREMAKQVAHEIKNPLTPLKLNIQYLQSFVDRDPQRTIEMVRQLTPAMIEQINNLDKIATEFSDFAKMPTATNEKVNLNEIVKAVHDFFRKREDLDFRLHVPINDLIVFADKNHLVSILNNIIKNAIQAIPTDRRGRILIQLYKEGDNSVIKIKDNGTGIAQDMVDKVFSPNFTTKSSGTGLGLAIASNMIQAFNGKIYFKTKEGEGTSFFVEIPLMRLKDNYPGQNRVMLDDE